MSAGRFSIRPRAGLLLALGAGALVITSGALADEVLQEVVVTAQKREQPVQDVPIAISALTGDAITTRGIPDLEGLANEVPGVQFTKSDQGGNNAGIYIRGIGQFDWLPTFDPGVGLYVDGVFLARTSGGLLDLTDIDRVEVLRGPQGTLFGKNTIGGAISIYTKEPQFKPEADVFVRAGARDRLDAGAILNLPLIDDTLAVRFTALTKNQEGFGRSLETGQRYGGEGKEVGKLSILWRASDSLTFDLSGDYTRVRQPIAMSLLLNINTQTFVTIPQNQWAVANGVTPYDQRWISPSYYTNYSIWDFHDHEDTWGTRLTVTQDWGSTQLKSISSYRNSRFLTGLSFDAAPSQMGDQIVNESDDQISQEFLLSGKTDSKRFEWVAGLYYLRENIFNGVYLPLSFPANPDGYDTYTTNKGGNTSYAVYGQGTLHFTDRFSMDFGLRYSYERKEDTIYVFATKFDAALLPSTPLEKDWNSVTYRVAAQYELAEHAMAYASISTGFKSGGFNGRAQSDFYITFDPEKATAYEIGLKSELLDRRLRLNLAAFQTEYRDIQTTLNLPDPVTGIVTNVVQNPADARIRGLELESQAVLTSWLSLDLAATTTSAEYTRLAEGTDVTRADHLPQVPSWTLDAGLELHVPVPLPHVDSGEFLARIDESHRASYYDGAPNTIYNYEPHRDLVNARLAYGPSDRQWQVAVYARNLLNHQYLDFHEDLMAFLYSIGTPAPPREVGGEVHYRW
jgi:iron complex outermembrane receptor protein